MYKHKTVNININNQIITVDEEMSNIIIALNNLKYKTSGCCVGEDGISEAWIIIQEINENRIIELMNTLIDCCYVITKQLYKNNSDNFIYIQYILTTPEGNIDKRVKWINEWVEKLSETVINPIQTVQYEFMEKLFE